MSPFERVHANLSGLLKATPEFDMIWSINIEFIVKIKHTLSFGGLLSGKKSSKALTKTAKNRR